MEIQGTFNAQRFFDTLALIISQRENVKVTVQVTQTPEKTEASVNAGHIKDFSKSISGCGSTRIKKKRA
ncbi:MAG: hypothetical protein KBS60_05350 [Phascolarctobacterium sp.]|nr:hypothetical protein [Candidatus Phascolarctobacterium caballi]